MTRHREKQPFGGNACHSVLTSKTFFVMLQGKWKFERETIRVLRARGHLPSADYATGGSAAHISMGRCRGSRSHGAIPCRTWREVIYPVGAWRHRTHRSRPSSSEVLALAVLLSVLRALVVRCYRCVCVLRFFFGLSCLPWMLIIFNPSHAPTNTAR